MYGSVRLATPAQARWPHIAGTFVAVCVVALCTQSYVPAASALPVDHTVPADRVPLFALFRVALNLGRLPRDQGLGGARAHRLTP